ncbi:MAG: hypothetical protein HYY93_11290 [Planctomycetes bacterium]|nr:hypothetical protein [Planctomycetota bacterium]
MTRWRLGDRITCADCGGSAVCIRWPRRKGMGMDRAFRCVNCAALFFPLPPAPGVAVRKRSVERPPTRRPARTASRS